MALEDEYVVVDIIKCDGHGYCAELFPERIGLDDWGFPIIDDSPLARGDQAHARRAITACPVQALRMEYRSRVRPD